MIRLSFTLILLSLTALASTGCYDYTVEATEGARLKAVPNFFQPDFFSPEPGSRWEVLAYKHGWVQVKGPVDKEYTGLVKTGWLREKHFRRIPRWDLKEAVGIGYKEEDVPVRWATVPAVIIVLAALLYINRLPTRLLIGPLIIILLTVLAIYLASRHRRTTQLGSRVFAEMGTFLKDKGGRVYTTDDIWRRRLNFYMDYKPTKNGRNTISALSLNRFNSSPGGYYVVTDPRFYFRITWDPPPFVTSGVFPAHWQMVKQYGPVKLFYVPVKGGGG